MKIGFDFDKVFVNYPPFVPTSVIDFFYKKKNHNLVYRFPGFIEQKIRIVSHHHFFRPPIRENIDSLSEIARKGKFELFLVSGRFGFLKDKTKHWLKKHDIEKYFKEMHFNFQNEQPHLFKHNIINKLNIKQFIDDDLDLLLHLASKNPHISFFWINGKNRSIKIPFPKNIIPIKNLEEFRRKYLLKNHKFKISSSK